jgi:hypothetical protein
MATSVVQIDNVDFKSGANSNVKMTATDALLTMFATSGNVRITGVANPTAPVDAATKQYVDASSSDPISWKLVSRAASTGNENLAATLDGVTVDGVLLAVGDRVLLKNQTLPVENGIYDVVAGLATRAVDYAVGAAVGSSVVTINAGTANANSGWVCTNAIGSDVVNTDNLTYVEYTGLGLITAGDGLDKVDNTLNVDSTVVRTSGAQSIAGVKTFTDATASTSTVTGAVVVTGGVGVGGAIFAGGNASAVSFIATSDENAKKDIQALGPATDALMRLEVVEYRWREGDDDHLKCGLIAQQVQKHVPDAVYVNPDGRMSVDYNHIFAMMLKSHQDHNHILMMMLKSQQELCDRLRQKR